MPVHALFSPSKLPRLVRCPGSFKASKTQPPQQSSTYADEGTMLHTVTEKCLDSNFLEVPDYVIEAFNLTQEHVDAVNDCLDYVFNLKQKHAETNPNAYDMIETKVSLSEFADDCACDALNDVWGTLDFSYVLPDERLLYVIDWKFGKGIEVFPDSEQTKAYALGKLKNKELASKIDKVVIVIGQPRIYAGEHFKTLETTPDELIKWLVWELVPALNSALSIQPTFNSSDKACRWCAVKATCEYRRAENQETAQRVFATYATLPNPDIETILSLLPRFANLRAYMADLELWLMGQLKKGKSVEGYKLVSGRSNRKWKNEAEAKAYLATLGYDEYDVSEIKFKSAPKIEKFLGKDEAQKQAFKDLIVKPEGKPTLVKATDKRPALVFKPAESVFEDYVE